MHYFFIHTIKTSGTTFVDVLQRDARNTVGYFYPPRREMDNFEKRVKEGPEYHLERNPDWRKFNFIVGHFTFGIHDVFKAQDFRYLGVVREPVSHYCSLFKHFMRMPEDYRNLIMPGEKSVNELLKRDYTHNMQTWFLSGLSMEDIRKDKERAYQTVIENYGKYFAGIYPTDRFDEGLFYFKHRIGITPQYYHSKNVSKNSIGQNLTPQLAERILEVNDVDTRVFEYFNKQFDRDLKSVPNLSFNLALFRTMNYLHGLSGPRDSKTE